MSGGTQEVTREITLVGMDAHSEKIALCVTRWRHGSEPVKVKELSTALDALEATYGKHVPAGALTVLEASTNSFSIAGRLAAVGHAVKVLGADTLAGMTRADRVNDRIDARNLALAYARGCAREVHVPSARHLRLRDVFFGHRNAVKDCVKWSNRIWSFCSGHGFRVPPRSRAAKAAHVREQVLALGWGAEDAFHVGTLLREYGHACGTRDLYQSRIEREAAADPDMARAMQVLGIRCVVAFALVAFIGDVRRFPSAKKLVSYAGLNPRVCETGESQAPRRVSRLGRRDLKALLVEAAQCALRTGRGPEHKWARRKLAQGKHANQVVCALARKMLVQVWHALMGHPVQDPEGDASFTRKLLKVAYAAGKDWLAERGHATAAGYAAAVCASLRQPVATPCVQRQGETP